MKIRDDILVVASGRQGFDWTHEADCHVYVVTTEDGLVMIDAGTGLSLDQIESHLNGYGFVMSDIRYVLLTHLHADHSGGAAGIRAASGAKVAVIDRAAPYLEAGDEAVIDLPAARENGYYPQDYKWRSCPVDIGLRDGEVLEIGSCRYTVIETPGHSQLDTCYWMHRPGRPPVLFAGDTVFYNGRISMLNTSDFNMRQLSSSMARLADLEIDLLASGHGRPALHQASRHIRMADQVFRSMGVPSNIE